MVICLGKNPPKQRSFTLEKAEEFTYHFISSSMKIKIRSNLFSYMLSEVRVQHIKSYMMILEVLVSGNT